MGSCCVEWGLSVVCPKWASGSQGTGGGPSKPQAPDNSLPSPAEVGEGPPSPSGAVPKRFSQTHPQRPYSPQTHHYSPRH